MTEIAIFRISLTLNFLFHEVFLKSSATRQTGATKLTCYSCLEKKAMEKSTKFVP